jgi:hypothetical protein
VTPAFRFNDKNRPRGPLERLGAKKNRPPTQWQEGGEVKLVEI